MIIGTGSDLIDIRRIEKTLERFGDRFTRRCFTEGEIALAERRRLRAETYAKRYAAKEACAKALGTGFRRGVYWRDLEVIRLPSGKPSMNLTGQAGQLLAGMIPVGMVPNIHLTITDEWPMGHAFVIIEAVTS